MRIILYSLVSVFALGSIASCKRCEVCSVNQTASYVDSSGVEITETGEVYSYPEVCGTNRDLKAYKDLCQIEFGDQDAFECICQED